MATGYELDLLGRRREHFECLPVLGLELVGSSVLRSHHHLQRQNALGLDVPLT
jgi:hypothetical protein